MKRQGAQEDGASGSDWSPTAPERQARETDRMLPSQEVTSKMNNAASNCDSATTDINIKLLALLCTALLPLQCIPMSH